MYNLSVANLYSTRRADCSESDLTGEDFSNADLPEANFSNSNLSKTDFSNANLSGADLSEAERSTSDKQIDGWTINNGRLKQIKSR